MDTQAGTRSENGEKSRGKGAGTGEGKTARDMITKARSAVMRESPFFAALCMHLVPVEAPWCHQGGLYSVATDGRHFFYHPHILEAFPTLSELKGLILHEVLHCAFRHLDRGKDRHPLVWNMAIDYAVNSIIREMDAHLKEQYSRLPQDKRPVMQGFSVDKGLHREDFRGMKAEQIYTILIKEMKDPPRSAPRADLQTGGGSDSTGEQRILDVHLDSDKAIDPERGPIDPGTQTRNTDAVIQPLSKGEQEHLIREWERRLIQAANNQHLADRLKGRSGGPLPGQIKELIETIKAPKVRVLSKVAKYLRLALTEQVNWIQPYTKRMAATGIYMPSKRNYVTDPVIVIDTSGSVSPEDAAFFLGLVDEVIRKLPVTKLRYIECDHAIQTDRILHKVHRSRGVYGVFPEPSLKEKGKGGGITISGRGGTSFKPPFELLERDKRFKPSFVLYLTDGHGDFPEKKPAFPVLWVFNNKEKHSPPFGDQDCFDKVDVDTWRQSRKRRTAFVSPMRRAGAGKNKPPAPRSL